MRKALKYADASDVLGLVGYLATVYGIGCWSVPAAWVYGGAVLMAIAIAPALRKGKG